jgi:hypothetical protein
MYRWLVLIGGPPGWSDLDQLAPTAHLIQPPDFDRAQIESRPRRLDSLPGRSRLVYATLGTVFGESAEIWAAIFAAIAAEPGLIATVGPAGSLHRFGTVAPNIRVERNVPLSWVLDVADAVIAHGGYGTLMGALRRACPSSCQQPTTCATPPGCARAWRRAPARRGRAQCRRCQRGPAPDTG